MKEHKRIEKFFHELERLLSGEEVSQPSDLSPGDLEALVVAQTLGQVDFSSESQSKAALYSRLLAQASAPKFKPAPRRRLGGSISWEAAWRTAVWAALGLALIIVMVWGINNLIPGFGQDPARGDEIPVVQPTLTPQASVTPSATLEPTPARTPTPEEVVLTYCQQLLESYQPAAGMQMYCDENFDFAFEYPQDWRIEPVQRTARSTIQRFISPDRTNFIRVDTFRSIAPLEEEVESFYFYEGRLFPEKDYQPMVIGGEAAYGFANLWVQYISGVVIFFEHANGYSVMELPAYSEEALDVTWQIASSIQVPGTTPEENIISDELVADSYLLVELASVTAEPPTATPATPTATPEPAVAPIRQYEGWEIIGYLTCNQMEMYGWVWNWASSGEYESTTPLFGVDRPVIYLPEVQEVCPDFSILPAIYAYDEWEIIGFLTCSELEQYDWVWTTREVGWYYSTTPLFGEEKPRINIHYGWSCPFSPQPPVRDPDSHEIIGFLTCSQMAEYEWVEIPDGSGFYESTTPIFGVESPVIMRQEVFLLCNFPAP
ncbi:MAG: hypothetical protein IBX69_12170 [Anaerolineales bacterium]|nr:hypothetical protein [Anaerolineales bacterium]